MYKGKKILAVIPARAHYDKIDQLNLKNLGGQPLISYTINAANKSKYIDRLFLSTENPEIVKLAASLGLPVPSLRPKRLVESGVTTFQVVRYVIQNIEDDYDIIIILLPNAPFRGSELIDNAIEFMIKSPYKKVQSVKPIVDHFLFKNGNNLSPLFKLVGGKNSEFSEVFTIAGGIYLFNKECLLYENKYKKLEFGNFYMHEHNARLIRSLYDLLIAERLIKLQQSLVDSLINAT